MWGANGMRPCFQELLWITFEHPLVIHEGKHQETRSWSHSNRAHLVQRGCPVAANTLHTGGNGLSQPQKLLQVGAELRVGLSKECWVLKYINREAKMFILWNRCNMLCFYSSCVGMWQCVWIILFQINEIPRMSFKGQRYEWQPCQTLGQAQS